MCIKRADQHGGSLLVVALQLHHCPVMTARRDSSLAVLLAGHLSSAPLPASSSSNRPLLHATAMAPRVLGDQAFSSESHKNPKP